MQPMPLVGMEVQRIRAAFAAATLELDAAIAALSDRGAAELGTPPADAVVDTGLGDLRRSLERLRGTADACVAVAARHVSESGTESAAEAGRP